MARGNGKAYKGNARKGKARKDNELNSITIVVLQQKLEQIILDFENLKKAVYDKNVEEQRKMTLYVKNVEKQRKRTLYVKNVVKQRKRNAEKQRNVEEQIKRNDDEQIQKFLEELEKDSDYVLVETDLVGCEKCHKHIHKSDLNQGYCFECVIVLLG